MDILYIGESSKLKGTIMKLDDPPTDLTVPMSLSLPDDTCLDFHTRADNYWVPPQVSVTSLTAASCTASSQMYTSYSEFTTGIATSYGIKLGGTYKTHAAA